MTICHGERFQSDDEFLDAVLTCRVPGSAFDHRGHLRIAWILLQRHPLDVAVRETCEGIRRLAAHLGAPDKFHWTLTEALVRIMAGVGASDRHQRFDAFLLAHPELSSDARSVVARHYSAERLADPDAQRGFITPDVRPLP